MPGSTYSGRPSPTILAAGEAASDAQSRRSNAKIISEWTSIEPANLGIRAIIEEARMTDNVLELGDPDGNALWRSIWRDRRAQVWCVGGALIAGVR